MKFCTSCGHPIDENAIFCPRCGSRINGDNPKVDPQGFDVFGTPYGSYYAYDYSRSKGVEILSFLAMEIGLIIWLFTRHTRPGKAKSALFGVLSRLAVGMPVVGLIVWLVWKDDVGHRDYAKTAGISAIVGAGLYAFIFVAAIVLAALGLLDESITQFPMGEAVAFITGKFLG